MRYLILIYENEANAPTDPAEFQKWMEYTERLKASGCYLGGEALQPTAKPLRGLAPSALCARQRLSSGVSACRQSSWYTAPAD